MSAASNLIDPKYTKAVLIGVSEFKDSKHFINAEPIKNNIPALKSLLLNHEIAGLAEENVLEFTENQRHDEILDSIEKFIKEGDIDTIIFYFAGHGFRTIEGEFYLVTNNSKSRRIKSTAILWEDVKRIFESASGIQQRFYIIDACHSGAATLGDENNLIEDIEKGSALLAAASQNEKAYFDRKEQYTFFTNAIIKTLEEGIDNVEIKGFSITRLFDKIIEQLRRERISILPQIKITDNIHKVNLFKNINYDSEFKVRQDLSETLSDIESWLNNNEFRRARRHLNSIEKSIKELKTGHELLIEHKRLVAVCNFLFKQNEKANEKIKKEQFEKERFAKEKAKKEKIESKPPEKEKLVLERPEKERLEREKAAKEKAIKEQLEKEEAAKEKAEKKRLENLRLIREKAKEERQEKDRLAREKANRAKRSGALIITVSVVILIIIIAIVINISSSNKHDYNPYDSYAEPLVEEETFTEETLEGLSTGYVYIGQYKFEENIDELIVTSENTNERMNINDFKVNENYRITQYMILRASPPQSYQNYNYKMQQIVDVIPPKSLIKCLEKPKAYETASMNVYYWSKIQIVKPGFTSNSEILLGEGRLNTSYVNLRREGDSNPRYRFRTSV
jgi:hypothetical protein